MLKDVITQAPILCYPDWAKQYIVYKDASDDACGAQLSQEHNGMEFPIASLSHTVTDTQRKWSTTEQKAYGVYYAVSKWNYYLQGAKVIIHNDQKPLARFPNWKNANKKWTDGDWNLQHTTLHSGGYWKPERRQLTVSLDLLNYHMIDKPQFRCSPSPIMMVQYLIPATELHNTT